jgi:hypothetical protein
MLAGRGRKLRIDVGGSVVEVNIGRLVERVCVDVVGNVLLLNGACVVSVLFPLEKFEDVDDDEDEFDPGVGELPVVEGTGTEMLALIMCTSALGCVA